MERLIEDLRAKLETEESVDATISIECKDIMLENVHDLFITDVEETEHTIEFDTDLGITFTIGKDAVSVDYLECENEYTFTYKNNVVITIMI